MKSGRDLELVDARESREMVHGVLQRIASYDRIRDGIQGLGDVSEPAALSLGVLCRLDLLALPIERALPRSLIALLRGERVEHRHDVTASRGETHGRRREVRAHRGASGTRSRPYPRRDRGWRADFSDAGCVRHAALRFLSYSTSSCSSSVAARSQAVSTASSAQSSPMRSKSRATASRQRTRVRAICAPAL